MKREGREVCFKGCGQAAALIKGVSALPPLDLTPFVS